MDKTRPFAYSVTLPGGIPSRSDDHVVRKLSDMEGYYHDTASYDALLAEGDIPLYEVYQILRPESSGELLNGLSILHAGKVGDEYFMTKGHFHRVLDTAEVYYCLQGQGMMVMEDPEGQCAVEVLRPGRVLYVPPRWAHRSVNTGTDTDLVTFYVFPGHAGHDYGSIQERGFRKQVIESNGQPKVVDNPRWAQR